MPDSDKNILSYATPPRSPPRMDFTHSGISSIQCAIASLALVLLGNALARLGPSHNAVGHFIIVVALLTSFCGLAVGLSASLFFNSKRHFAISGFLLNLAVLVGGWYTFPVI
jgi:hypothetical protein